MTSPLLKVDDLTVRFRIGGGLFRKQYLTAVDGVSLEIPRGATVALVGESGSGKSTTALAIARLVKAQAGSVKLDGLEVLDLQGDALRQMRQRMQFIFQDPYSSLNPRLRAERIVREPLDSLGKHSHEESVAIVDELFTAVGLRPEQRKLFPHQFSGGQRQRIGIARALSTRPDIVICDEPVSALDVAVQSQILNLLQQLQDAYKLTYLFISHDLGVVQHMCDTVAVMYMGEIVEYASRQQLFATPQHPYTQALLAAVPSVNRRRAGLQATMKTANRISGGSGDKPGASGISADGADTSFKVKGCRFASRCPHRMQRCDDEAPVLRTISVTQRLACHLGD